MTLGEFIQQQRKLKGMTQRELARQLVISDGYMSKIENDREQPKPFVMENIAIALDLDYYELALMAGYVPQPVIEAMQQRPGQAIAIWRKFADYE